MTYWKVIHDFAHNHGYVQSWIIHIILWQSVAIYKFLYRPRLFKIVCFTRFFTLIFHNYVKITHIVATIMSYVGHSRDPCIMSIFLKCSRLTNHLHKSQQSSLTSKSCSTKILRYLMKTSNAYFRLLFTNFSPFFVHFFGKGRC